MLSVSVEHAELCDVLSVSVVHAELCGVVSEC